LIKEAHYRGVDASRLIFAKRIDLDEHLARHHLADLFIDTLPCNAHTTASDALWAGLPLLTCTGHSFASRVAASLLNSLALSELITHSQTDFEARAIELATTSTKLCAIKNKLSKNRLAAPLFSSCLFAKNLETAYEEIFKRHLSSQAADHITISP
jgi:predicted O-linked N-acetylglucosamine transferase (SPINDLY family)